MRIPKGVILDERPTNALLKGLTFLKPVWLALFSPRQFFTAYTRNPDRLAAMSYPLSGVWKRLTSAPETVMAPYQCLGMALGLLGTAAFIQGIAYELVLPEAILRGMSNVGPTSERFFEWSTGLRLVKIDTQHLTGFAPIDKPVGDLIQLWHYLWFAVLFALFLGRSTTRQTVVHYFAYSLSTCVAIQVCAALVGLVVFIFLLIDLDMAFAASGFVELAGMFPMLFYALILPAMLFPDLLNMSKRRVVRATLWAVGAWIGTNLFLTQVLLIQMGIMIVF